MKQVNVQTPGAHPEPQGATLDDSGANFAVYSSHADRIEICLFDAKDRETDRVSLRQRRGDVFFGRIEGLAEGQRYGLRAHGPNAPSRGHRFDASKLLLDPFAREIDRPFRLSPSLFSDGSARDSAAAMPKAVLKRIAPSATIRPHAPWSRTILYEAHAKGFGMRHPGIAPEKRGRFAALAEPAAIAHFHRLGVTSIETLPLAASIDERHLPPLGLTNYWGYNPVAFMAPDPRLAPGGWAEIAQTVDALHREGLELIVDVVFNHTGEGDQNGPTLSLRGLDNASYYRLRLDDPTRYLDDAGTGNTLRCDHPQTVRLVLDSLRAWAIYGGVDGFRFDLATTFGRRRSGFDPHAPLFAAILQDPLLRSLKLIAEAWDIGPGGYQVGSLDAPFADWNDRYRDGVRRYWKGDREVFGELATRIAGSADLFAKRRHPSASINFVVAHDGFTLRDLVSYERKANLANGENNRDGTDANHAWNNGFEGPTDDAAINTSRARDQRNLLATLLLSLGTPMLLAGSEFGQTQGGNNNAYAQDNAISWLDWERADESLTAFTSELIRLRQSHAVFGRDRFLAGAPVDGVEHPDVLWLRPDGKPMTGDDWDGASRDTVIALFAAPGERGVERLLVSFHRGGKPLRLVLPAPRKGMAWGKGIDTGAAAFETGGAALVQSARSVLALKETGQSPAT